MFCPQCGAEYREGFYECSDCHVDLVIEKPVKEEPEYISLVTVLSTGSKGLIAVASSILEGAGIEFRILGDGIQDLFALGRLGVGYNPVLGSCEIKVHPDDAGEASVLLSDLDESPDTYEDGDDL